MLQNCCTSSGLPSIVMLPQVTIILPSFMATVATGPPISTSGDPVTMTPPWTVGSPSRAAIFLPQ
jgi:hypothetical protein